MDRDRLNILIDRYFDGELSVAEEHCLLEELLRFPQGDEEIDSALAVMGYARMPNGKRKGGTWNHRMFRWAAAAVVAGVVAVAAIVPYAVNSSASDCYAYVDGKKIVDKNEIEQLVSSDLSDMGDASEDVALQVNDDLNDFKGLLK